jgi:hypothetical protein
VLMGALVVRWVDGEIIAQVVGSGLLMCLDA